MTARITTSRHERHRKMMAGEVSPTHGTYSTYMNYACKCKPCRRANLEYVRVRRLERNRAMLAGEITVTHGKLTTYTNYMCKCDRCKAAAAASRRRTRGSAA